MYLSASVWCRFNHFHEPKFSLYNSTLQVKVKVCSSLNTVHAPTFATVMHGRS